MNGPGSFFNRLDATLLEVLEVIAHFLQTLGGMPRPFRDLADDAEWTPGTVGHCWISRKFPVRQVWIIFDGSCWLHDIDPAAACADGQFSSPDGRIQRRGQVNESCLFPLAIVGSIARFDQAAHIQVGFRAVVIRLRISHRATPACRHFGRPAIVHHPPGLAASPLALYKLMVGRRAAPPFFIAPSKMPFCPARLALCQSQTRRAGAGFSYQHVTVALNVTCHVESTAATRRPVSARFAGSVCTSMSHCRRIFSSALPFASSSMSLSR